MGKRLIAVSGKIERVYHRCTREHDVLYITFEGGSTVYKGRCSKVHALSTLVPGVWVELYLDSMKEVDSFKLLK